MSLPKIDLSFPKNLYPNLLNTQAISQRSIGIGTNNDQNYFQTRNKTNDFNNIENFNKSILKNSITSHNSKTSLFSYSNNSKKDLRNNFPLFSNNLLRNRHELNFGSNTFQPLIFRNNIISFSKNKKLNLIVNEDKDMINFFKNETKSNFNNKYNIIFKTNNDKKKV